VTGTIKDYTRDRLTLFDDDRTEPGPSGGVSISSIGIDGSNRAVFNLGVSVASLGITANSTVIISGIPSDGPALLNGVVVARSASSNSFTVDVDIHDTGIYPTYTTGGIATPQGGTTGWFDGGPITILDGDNAMLGARMVRAYLPGQITLQEALPFDLPPYARYSMSAGDDHFFETCKVKFSNYLNFGGLPYLPGQDKRVQVGRSE
jgi:hypothetical protein